VFIFLVVHVHDNTSSVNAVVAIVETHQKYMLQKLNAKT